MRTGIASAVSPIAEREIMYSNTWAIDSAPATSVTIGASTMMIDAEPNPVLRVDQLSWNDKRIVVNAKTSIPTARTAAIARNTHIRLPGYETNSNTYIAEGSQLEITLGDTHFGADQKSSVLYAASAAPTTSITLNSTPSVLIKADSFLMFANGVYLQASADATVTSASTVVSVKEVTSAYTTSLLYLSDREVQIINCPCEHILTLLSADAFGGHASGVDGANDLIKLGGGSIVSGNVQFAFKTELGYDAPSKRMKFAGGPGSVLLHLTYTNKNWMTHKFGAE